MKAKITSLYKKLAVMYINRLNVILSYFNICSKITIMYHSITMENIELTYKIVFLCYLKHNRINFVLAGLKNFFSSHFHSCFFFSIFYFNWIIRQCLLFSFFLINQRWSPKIIVSMTSIFSLLLISRDDNKYFILFYFTLNVSNYYCMMRQNLLQMHFFIIF